MDHTRIEWTTLEYIHRPKSADWFWAVGLVTIACAIAAYLFANPLFTIFILTAGFTVMVLGARVPKEVRFGITKDGIIAHGSLIPFKTLSSFWVHDDTHPPRIVLKSQKLLVPHMTIPTGDMDLRVIRRTLAQHLKEERHEISLIEALAGYFELYM